MKNIQNIGYVYAIACIIIGVAIGLTLQKHAAPVRLGSIALGEAYNATTTQTSWAGNSGGFQLIKPGYGMLGSVVITSASSLGTINIYDGTTTVNGGLYGTTTLASINTGTLSGTYTFDASFSKGLIVVSTAGIATTTTITWK